ncbi:MAG: winged helix-turn-helix transcriptional regulator [Nanoarchaeota archaeon]|nr:winged helix-turn-helix transcriptional regulator [Nanoarchaeota archaeon]
MLKETYSIFFGTLDNKYRFKIISLLREGSKNVTQICKVLNMNQTTVSHNLARLKTCGFVFVRNDGNERIYSLNSRTIKPLMKLIDEHMGTYCKKLCKC